MEEQLQIWADLFGFTPEQAVDHWSGCLRCAHDVRGQSSRAEEERAARALSACQTKFCLGNLPPPIRCVSKDS